MSGRDDFDPAQRLDALLAENPFDDPDLTRRIKARLATIIMPMEILVAACIFGLVAALLSSVLYLVAVRFVGPISASTPSDKACNCTTIP